MMTTFYIAPSGNDNNAGTKAQPMASLQAVQWKTQPGDTVLLETGTYQLPYQFWQVSGTANAGIIISADTGATATLDGGNVANQLTPLCVYASYVTVENLNITNSPGAGLVFFAANNCTANNVTVSNSQGTGIQVGNSQDQTMLQTQGDIIQFCTIYNNCLSNAPPVRGQNSSWGAGISIFGASNIVVKYNNVYQNFGEGIDLLQANLCWAYGNTARDNFSVNVYFCNATNSHVYNNFIDCTENPYYFRDGRGAVGIGLANEGATNFNNNDTIDDNVVVGGFYSFATYDNWGYGYAFRNTLVINNTFYNAESSLLYIENSMGTDVGDRIANNIFDQPGSAAWVVYQNGMAGLSYDHNLWWGGDWSTWGLNGTGDVWADPLFVSPGESSANAYQLGSGSPAQYAGTANGAPPSNFNWVPWGSGVDIGAW